MKSSKKAMEMSMNTVIIAVIALLILGLMIYILSKNTGGFNKGLSCPGYGGKCDLSCDSKKDEITYIGKYLCDDNGVCCSLVPGKGKIISEDGKTVLARG